MTTPFWEEKSFEEMSIDEWESLCDGCGKCCLHKLEDDATDEVFYTRVACQYMNADDCRCSVYPRRAELVPNCITLTPQDVPVFHWLPSTCAYRLIAEGRPLNAWHPLISNDRTSVHAIGVSMAGKTVSEEHIHPSEHEEHIIHWVE